MVDQVRHGESILILDRGRPVARLESVLDAEFASQDRMARLERQGLIRRGERKNLQRLFEKPPPTPKGGASALELLLKERRSG